MKRREFITLVGCGAVAWPLTARSQQSGRFRRIGVLAGSAESAEVRSRTAAFLLTLQNLGWRVDDNIQIDVRWLGSDPGRIQTETADLIARKPEVIVSGTSIAVAQILRTSSTAISSLASPIRLARGSSKAWRAPTVMLPASPLMRSRSAANGSRH
jgi:putative tryptophan/tyrosine transport system substrate-binding protein